MTASHKNSGIDKVILIYIFATEDKDHFPISCCFKSQSHTVSVFYLRGKEDVLWTLPQCYQIEGEKSN